MLSLTTCQGRGVAAWSGGRRHFAPQCLDELQRRSRHLVGLLAHGDAIRGRGVLSPMGPVPRSVRAPGRRVGHAGPGQLAGGARPEAPRPGCRARELADPIPPRTGTQGSALLRPGPGDARPATEVDHGCGQDSYRSPAAELARPAGGHLRVTWTARHRRGRRQRPEPHWGSAPTAAPSGRSGCHVRRQRLAAGSLRRVVRLPCARPAGSEARPTLGPRRDRLVGLPVGGTTEAQSGCQTPLAAEVRTGGKVAGSPHDRARAPAPSGPGSKP
jgi:hypothetical protein